MIHSPLGRRRRLVGGLGALAVTCLIVAGCSGTEESSTSSADDQDTSQVVVAWTGDLNSMDPPFSLVEWNREAALNTYETLVNYATEEDADGSLVYQGLDVSPALAESWDVDGATVTFHLAPDATFYPSGNPVTAADVKWSFERTVRVEGGFGKFNANLAGIFEPETQVQVIDDKTVSITFTNAQGEPMLLEASIPSMRFPQFSIIDSVAAQEHATADDPWAAEWLADNVAGSGPYYIESRTPNEETVFAANPDYWGEAPAIERVIARVTGDSDLVALMENGDIDMVTVGLGTRQFDALEESGFQVINQSIPNIVQLQLAVDDPLLSDPLVREAIAYAVPYEEILAVANGGRGERALSYVNPASVGYKDSWTQYDTDLERAQELLDEAGVGELTIPLYYDSGIAANEDTALLLQDSLAEIGVTVEVTPQPTTQFAEQRTARVGGTSDAHSGMMLSSGVIWLDDPDPNTDTAFKTSGSSNWTHYSNAEVDDLHLGNRFNPDAAARATAYERVQDVIAAELPTIPLMVTGRTVALSPGLQGAMFTADSHNRYWSLHWE